MTMTREEALTIVTSIVREHSRECREPKPCQDCELEAEAIAALSAQEPVAGWASELELAELQRDMAKNNQVTCIISLASRQSAHKRIPLYAAPPAQADTKQAEPCPWVRQSSEGTAYCELAESGAKQAEAVSPWLPIETAPRDGTERGPGRPVLLYVGGAVVSAQHYANDCWVTEYSCTEHVYAPTFWREPLPAPPALHQLGAKVEVSDG